MAEVKLSGKSLEQRLADRRKNSGEGLNADVRAKSGDGDRRTFHNIMSHGHSGPTHEAKETGRPGSGADEARRGVRAGDWSKERSR